MVYVLGVGFTLVLVALGLHRRWRARLPLDVDYLSRLVWRSIGFGMAVGTLVLPAFWVLVSYSLRGGRIEDNLPPGGSASFLLTLLLVGTLMTLVYTFTGYYDHVFPYRIVEGQMRDPDSEPLQRKPDDLPD